MLAVSVSLSSSTRLTLVVVVVGVFGVSRALMFRLTSADPEEPQLPAKRAERANMS